MQTIEVQETTANSEVKISPVSDIIDALENILAHARVLIPDLETPFSRFPNTDQSNMHKNQSISATIIERQQQLDTVLHEISGLETVMDGIKNLHQQLVEKKDRITQSMNAYKGLASPLWRLPTEVLSQVFDQCIPNVDCLYPSRLEAPMLLTEICRRWREVAVGLPSLWCRLCVVDDGDWQRAAVFYESWLKRSRGCPLSLAFDCFANNLTGLRNLFQPYLNQISSLSVYFLEGTDQTSNLLLLQDLPKDLPALQEVNIFIEIDLAISILSIAQSISRLPSTLRSLKVTGLLFDVEEFSSLHPVLAHLTNVEISMPHPKAFLHFLQLCPNLSSLTVHAEFGWAQTLEPFTHTEIRSLRINFDYANTRCLSGLFDALSLPNLRVFEALFIQTWPHTQFKAFLARSKCPLERLLLGRGVGITDEQRAEYVVLIPSLEVVLDHSYSSFE
ncbi:uncharacterized protein EDB91DRAFT_52462 [Suillus paluster]|uniref:uncharacterized protein n=1 Tax=Suillus paluster TaxID=48578 RepID=UPI001B875A27|nr:uncharacterized protein EDB91DRAFT_52462 [Suillus paluster]KAG1747974.1 hypothetical protein EDB91DRAFT_52462 [Suillus paluster]